MPVLGYVVILIGLLLIRQVAVGRAANAREDLSTLLTSALRGDIAGVKDVTSRRSTVTPGVTTDLVTPGVAGSLEDEMRRIGTGRPYVFGAEGPNAYDCSGLVWRAMYNLGIYKGPRFLADQSFVRALAGHITLVSTPERGDIVLWSGHHMGIVVGPDRMFSALNPRDGIIESSISGNSQYYDPPQAPAYYRGDWS